MGGNYNKKGFFIYEITYDDGFIVYSDDRWVIQRLLQYLRVHWDGELGEESTEYIKQMLKDQYLYCEYLDDDELDYDKFIDNDNVYIFGRKQIRILKYLA